MANTKKINVEVKSDHIEKIASGSPEMAIAEMVWNALDADATVVDVNFHEGPLGVNQISIEDNGTGIPYKDAESYFKALGGSWKSNKSKTKNGRYLHGKDGKGRFKVFILGEVVEWEIFYQSGNEIRHYEIKGKSNKIDEFILSEEEASSGAKTGVTVKIYELSKKFHILQTDKAIERLIPIFALYLCNYPEVSLNIDGIKLDPSQAIKNKKIVNLPAIEKDEKSYDVELEIIEWNQLKEREIWFCNEKGFPLEIYNKIIRGIGEFGFSGYLKSEYFQIMQNENQLALGELNPDINKVCGFAIKEIKDYFQQRQLERAKDTIEKWKEEEVYPYENEPNTPIETAERQIFEIIALNVNENLPDLEQADKKTKAFQFRMLRQAIEKSPQDLQSIIQEVLQLSAKKQEQLAELLKDHSLSGIISASKMVSDRLKFIAGLEQILFDTEIKSHIKERSQLHRILAENTWFFGHSFSLSVDDQSLTQVLKKHSAILNNDIAINDPVKRLDGTKGIIDLMLSRSIPRNRSNELEHLVVELKAPKVVIGEKEISQIKSYAFAVAADERFKSINTHWNFWVISNVLDSYAEFELSQDKYENGVIFKSSKDRDITIWVKTWSQLIQENKHNLEFIRQRLNYSIDRDNALEYLKKTYAEYTKGILLIENAGEKEDKQDLETGT